MLASYTYGHILGMFAFGILTHRIVRDRLLPVVAILSPLCCFVLASHSEQWLWGYRFSYELLIMNALFTYVGMWIISTSSRPDHKRTSNFIPTVHKSARILGRLGNSR